MDSPPGCDCGCPYCTMPDLTHGGHFGPGVTKPKP